MFLTWVSGPRIVGTDPHLYSPFPGHLKQLTLDTSLILRRDCRRFFPPLHPSVPFPAFFSLTSGPIPLYKGPAKKVFRSAAGKLRRSAWCFSDLLGSRFGRTLLGDPFLLGFPFLGALLPFPQRVQPALGQFIPLSTTVVPLEIFFLLFPLD